MGGEWEVGGACKGPEGLRNPTLRCVATWNYCHVFFLRPLLAGLKPSAKGSRRSEGLARRFGLEAGVAVGGQSFLLALALHLKGWSDKVHLRSESLDPRSRSFAPENWALRGPAP